jgi:hypothetical protein
MGLEANKLDAMTRAVGFLAAFSFTVFGSACSGSGGGGQPSAPSPAASTQATGHAVHVLLHEGTGQKVQADIPPVGLQQLARSAPTNGSTMGAPSQRSQAIEPIPGHEITVDGEDPGWRLAWGAAVQCVSELESKPSYLQHIVTTPWAAYDNGDGASGIDWYLYFTKEEAIGGVEGNEFSSCDDVLFHEQLTLCTAQKLADVANAIETIEWPGPASVSVFDDVPNSPWRQTWSIPPQKTVDRFIARDLAINALGALARLDLRNHDGIEDCARSYARSLTDGAYAVTNARDLFGVSANHTPEYFPPQVTVTGSNAAALATSRLEIQAHTLRAGARLLKDLVTASAYGDLSGAMDRRQSAGDLLRGSELFWGVREDAPDLPYNTLNHALRTLFGRVEMGVPDVGQARGWPLGDPACASLGQYDLLYDFGSQATGASFSPPSDARWHDLPVRSAAQSLAMSIIEAAGIIIPPVAVDSAGMPAVRAAVLDQLMVDAAARRGATVAEIEASATGQALTAQLSESSLSDEDLRFGIDKVWNAFSLLTGTPYVQGTPAEHAGAQFRTTDISTQLQTISGAVLSQSLPRSDITSDVMGRLGAVQRASQCLESGSGVLARTQGQISSFQNVFMMGDIFRQRLDAMGDRIGSANEHLAQLANEGAAEVRTWSGAGRLMLVRPQGEDTTFEVILAGFTLAELGLRENDDEAALNEQIKKQVKIVRGDAWRAECVAGLRKSCFDPFVPGPIPTIEPAEVSWNLTSSAVGFGRRYLDMILPAESLFFNPDGTSQGIYVVLTSDPAETAHGKVLGALATTASTDPDAFFVQEVASDYQRQLANNIFGVSPSAPQEVGAPDLGESAGYCIENIPKDFFVPLENELTSDNDQFEDSWKHYLDAATLAASHTDEIGREIIRLGEQKDLRREAAGEELAEVCGSFTALDSVSVQDGKVTAPNTDGPLADCLDEPKKDLVFLTTDPVGDGPLSEAQKGIYLSCENGGASNPLCDPAVTPSHAGLGLAPADLEEPADCADTAHQAAVGSTDSMMALALDPAVQPAVLGGIVAGMHLKLDESVQWSLNFNGVVLMKSDDVAYWPGCASVSAGCASSNNAGYFASIFSTSPPPPAPGAPSGSLSAVARYNTFQEVAKVLWSMGAISGAVPEGLIDMPVPAGNVFADNHSQLTEAPAPILYGKSEFSLDDSMVHYRLRQSTNGFETDQDRLILGAAAPISAEFAAAAATSPSELVAWVYGHNFPAAPQSSRLHLRAQNAAVFGETSAGLYGIIARSGSPGHTMVGSVGGCLAKDGKTTISGYYMNDYFGMNDDGPLVANDIIPGWTTAQKGDMVNQANLPSTENGCLVGRHGGIHILQTGNCLARARIPNTQIWRFTENALLPSACPPSKRLPFFIQGADHGVNSTVGQVFAMACTLGSKFRAVEKGGPIPPLSSPADLGKFENWLSDQSENSRRALGMITLQGVPERVVKDFKEGKVGTGALAGQHGQLVLQLEADLSSIASSWLVLSGNFDQVKNAIQGTRLGLAGVDFQSDIAMADLAIRQIQTHADIAQALVHAEGDAFSLLMGNAGAIYDAGANINKAISDGDILDELDKINTAQEMDKANKVSQVLSNLGDKVIPIYSEMKVTLENLKAASARAKTTLVQLAASQSKAQYEAAKGAGSDFVEIGGQIVPLPVNTVLNRQYDIQNRRYKDSLKNTKILAYMARLAIEQRIGRRLNSIDLSVGNVPSPSTWADDICTFQGVNYEALRAIDVQDNNGQPTVDTTLAAQFADPFVGDYVEKLSNFVEYFNIEYPSHEGDDLTVLSLRDDLAVGEGQCYRESKNLLTYSSALDSGFSTSEGVLSGWQLNACDSGETQCLQVSGGLSDFDGEPEAPPADAAGGGVTWLHDVPKVAPMDAPPEPPADGVNRGPSRSAFQDVPLRSGNSYILSWWDMSRAADGAGDPGAVSADYVVKVLGPTGEAVATAITTPIFGGGGGVWSPRRALTFTAVDDGSYRVVFKPSLAGNGSVAIADVQLEQTNLSGAPAKYENTTSSRLVVTGDCVAGDSKAFKKLFDYRCEGGSCFYELRQPLIIDTKAINAGTSKLIGRIARGNYNFRHIDVSVNIVGTGVNDCAKTPQPSCYGSGYLEYTLTHDAYSVGVLDYEGRSQPFNFGTAAIRRGKALSIERYLTVPLGTADDALLKQPEIAKPEFRGRPLDGSYRLRIHDTPALAWDAVEDVQLALTYRYWSQVSRQDSNH